MEYSEERWVEVEEKSGGTSGSMAMPESRPEGVHDSVPRDEASWDEGMERGIQPVWEEAAEAARASEAALEAVQGLEVTATRQRRSLEKLAVGQEQLHRMMRALGKGLQQIQRELSEKTVEDGEGGPDLSRIEALLELQGRRQEEISSDFIADEIQRPFYRFLVRHCGQLLKVVGHSANASGEETGEEILAEVDDLTRYLKDQGLELILPRIGDAFDPHKHRPLSRRPTSNPEMDGRISKVHRPGCVLADRIVEAAHVEVFFLEASVLRESTPESP